MFIQSLYSREYQDDGKKTFSRDQQDRYAIDHIFNKKYRGFFLDIGALDGLYENNTLLMEQYYDWNGICCECDPRDIDVLRKSRKCNIVCSPMYKTTGEIVNFNLHRSVYLSGIIGLQKQGYYDPKSQNIFLSTISLNDCLDKCNAPKIVDYMSLDTEGSEFEILSTFNFSKYKINYIALEHNFQSPKRENIKNLMENNGYVLHRSIVCDDDYIRKDFAIENNIPLSL
jgi:hypothetical protein